MYSIPTDLTFSIGMVEKSTCIDSLNSGYFSIKSKVSLKFKLLHKYIANSSMYLNLDITSSKRLLSLIKSTVSIDSLISILKYSLILFFVIALVSKIYFTVTGLSKYILKSQNIKLNQKSVVTNGSWFPSSRVVTILRDWTSGSSIPSLMIFKIPLKYSS